MGRCVFPELKKFGAGTLFLHEFGEVVEQCIQSCPRFEQVWTPGTPVGASLGGSWRFVCEAFHGLRRSGLLGRHWEGWREFGVVVVEIRIRSCPRFDQVWGPGTAFGASLGRWWRLVYLVARRFSKSGQLGRQLARVLLNRFRLQGSAEVCGLGVRWKHGQNGTASPNAVGSGVALTPYPTLRTWNLGPAGR